MAQQKGKYVSVKLNGEEIAVLQSDAPAGEGWVEITSGEDLKNNETVWLNLETNEIERRPLTVR